LRRETYQTPRQPPKRSFGLSLRLFFCLRSFKYGDGLFIITPSKEPTSVKAPANFIHEKAEMGIVFGLQLKGLFEDSKININAIAAEAHQLRPHLAAEEIARLETQPNVGRKRIKSISGEKAWLTEQFQIS